MNDELVVRIAYKIRASRKRDFNMTGNEAQGYARIALAEIAAAGRVIVTKERLAELEQAERMWDMAESAAMDRL